MVVCHVSEYTTKTVSEVLKKSDKTNSGFFIIPSRYIPVSNQEQRGGCRNWLFMRLNWKTSHTQMKIRKNKIKSAFVFCFSFWRGPRDAILMRFRTIASGVPLQMKVKVSFTCPRYFRVAGMYVHLFARDILEGWQWRGVYKTRLTRSSGCVTECDCGAVRQKAV